MSINNFIQRVCVQTAVYWGNPVNDGYGGHTYDDPVEIPCRWEEKSEVKSDDKGNELISHATVLVTQDLDLDGYLCLGTFSSLGLVQGTVITMDDTGITMDNTDITMDNAGNVVAAPIKILGSFRIKVKDKIPMIRSTSVFVRTVYL